MGARLFVGNLKFSVDARQLRAFADASGVAVRKAEVARDRETGESKGYGFLEADGEEAEALGKLEGAVMFKRRLTVEAAR